MNKQLVEIIQEQTKIFLFNVNTTIQTCDVNFDLNGVPNWKQLYHALHSLDMWFINPERYIEPSFHESNLNSMFIKGEKALSKQELLNYFETVKTKIQQYLSTLTDDMLSESPDNCKYTRLALILGQYRHLYSHIGILNCTTIIQTNRWPRIVGLDGDFSKDLYEMGR